MTPHIIQLIHNFHDKCEDALTTEDYDSAKIWLEAADDTVEALGRELADECDCELEGEIELTPIGCVNIIWC